MREKYLLFFTESCTFSKYSQQQFLRIYVDTTRQIETCPENTYVRRISFFRFFRVFLKFVDCDFESSPCKTFHVQGGVNVEDFSEMNN